MYVSDFKFAILKAIARSYPIPTSYLREVLQKDPHPALGRLERSGAISSTRDGWILTPMGFKVLEVALLERDLHYGT